MMKHTILFHHELPGFQLNFSLNLEGNISGREVILPFNLPSMVINNKKYFKQTTKNTRTGNLHFLEVQAIF